MKKLFFILFLVITFVELSFSQTMTIHTTAGRDTFNLISIDSITFSISNVIPTDGLVAYYPFNGNTIDESGNGNHGSVIGTGVSLTTDRFGNPNSAYSFDGVDGYIDIQDDQSLRPGHITLASWVNPSLYQNMQVLNKSDFANASNEQYATVFNVQNGLVTGIKRNSSCLPANGWYQIFTQLTPLNTWSFITTTWDGSVLKFYVNGILVDSNNSVPSGNMDDCPGGNLRIGIGLSGDLPWSGFIDDVRIFNRALSPEEIRSLYFEGM